MNLWIDDNGRIECERHGGSYLASAIANAPRRNRHRTPIGTWDRIDAMFVEEWEKMMGTAPACETCR